MNAFRALIPRKRPVLAAFLANVVRRLYVEELAHDIAWNLAVWAHVAIGEQLVAGIGKSTQNGVVQNKIWPSVQNDSKYFFSSEFCSLNGMKQSLLQGT